MPGHENDASCTYENSRGYMMCNAAICQQGTYCDSFDRCSQLYQECLGYEGASCVEDSSFPWTLTCNGQSATVDVTRFSMQIPGVGVITCDHPKKKPMIFGTGWGRKLLQQPL